MGNGVFGWSMALGGVLTLLVNAILTPLMLQLPPSEMAASDIFLVRLSLAAFGVLLLLIGLVGAYARHTPNAPRLGGATFALAFVGTALLFAHEWGQVFFVHSLARVDGEALVAMEGEDAFNLYNLEAMIVVGVFTLGWIAFAASLMAGRTVGRGPPALIILGFFAIPFAALAVHLIAGQENAYWGAVAGNIVLSSGWILTGRALSRV